MNILLIGNPVAGRGRANQQIKDLVRILERRGHRVNVSLTRAAGSARRWASQIKPGIEAIVVAGGDGTLNEVLNGILDPSQIPIALFPLGTANVLARELGLPKKPEQLAEILEQGVIRKLDMGLLGGRRFLLLVSVGFDAMVTEKMRRTRKGSLGYRGYLLPILRVLAHYRPPKLRIEVDGQKDLTGALVMVSNVRTYGGIFKVADRACCDSGHLDICIFPCGTIPDLFRYAVRAFRGSVSTLAEVGYLTGRRIWIESDEPVAVEVDGDYFGTTPVVIDLKPACVPILVPARNSSVE
jgi:YegS/Rv2252/BmrU family lipid kinase